MVTVISVATTDVPVTVMPGTVMSTVSVDVPEAVGRRVISYRRVVDVVGANVAVGVSSMTM